MTTRTDIHRPSVIEPAHYDFVAFEYLKAEGDLLGNALFLQAERARIRAHMSRTGGTYSHHAHGGNCHICGAHAVYTALFFHTPSNAYVRTGLDCAQKLECHGIEAFRANVRGALENQAGKRKAQATLEVEGLEKAWEVYTATNNPDKFEELTIVDIVGKLVQYGNVSDKQMAFVRKLVSNLANRATIEAERAAKNEAAKPLPVSDKRVKITGTVVTIKKPAEFLGGDPWRILVEHADGWKVWGSRPASLSDVARGDEVEFSAAVTASDRDPKFGFFKRPTLGKITKKASAGDAS